MQIYKLNYVELAWTIELGERREKKTNTKEEKAQKTVVTYSRHVLLPLSLCVVAMDSGSKSNFFG